MSFRVVGKVLRHSEEKLARRLILIVLGEAAHDDGVAWLGQDIIAAKSRIALSHVKRCLGEMEDAGVIEIRKANRGRRRINVYRVVLPGLDEVDYDRLPFGLDQPFTTSEIQTPSEADDVRSTHVTTSDPRRKELVLSSSCTEPSIEPEVPLREQELARPPRLLKIDDRNLGFDALAEVCGIDTRNRVRSGEIAKALKDIRAYEFADCGEDGEVFERHVAATIRARAAAYRRAFPDLTLTPTALAKWWHDVDRAGSERRGREDRVAPEELIRRARALADGEADR